MEEDVVGTERVLNHQLYVTCARCGKAAPLHSASVIAAGTLEDGSEYQYLCSECQKSLANGEQDLPNDVL